MELKKRVNHNLKKNLKKTAVESRNFNNSQFHTFNSQISKNPKFLEIRKSKNPDQEMVLFYSCRLRC